MRLLRTAGWLAAALAVLAERLAVRPDVAIAPASCWTAGAAAAAAIAGAESAAGRTDHPALLVPDYLRPSYAEDRG